MRIQFLVYVLNGAESSVPNTRDARPAEIVRRLLRNLAAFMKISVVSLVNIGFRAGVTLTLAHERLSNLNRHIEPQNQIRLWQTIHPN